MNDNPLKRTSNSSPLVLLLSAVALLAATGRADAVTYEFTMLGGPFSVGNGINATGQVAGRSSPHQATRWDRTGATVLNAFGGASQGTAINDAGQVTGWADVGGGATAVVWNGATPTKLSHEWSMAEDLNDAGQIAGGIGSRAVRWDGTTPITLGMLVGAGGSWAYAINDTGQVAGRSDFGGGTIHATLWNGTTPTDLGTLGGRYSYGIEINNGGQVVGYSDTAAGLEHATLWTGGTQTDLGTLGGKTSAAYGINDREQIVGSSLTAAGSRRATLWSGGAAVDLNDFLDADTRATWLLDYAFDINDRGWITGAATNKLTGAYQTYLLSAVPESGSWDLLLVGLSTLGFAVRRRRVHGNTT